MKMSVSSGRVAAILLLTIAILACSSDSRISSDEVNTHQIFATLQIVSDGSEQIFAEAQLTREYPPGHSNSQDLYISLSENDGLWLSAGAHFNDINLGGNLFEGLQQVNSTQSEFKIIREIRYSFLLGSVRTDGNRYAARLPRSENDEYRIALVRNHFVDAPSSMISLPLDFALYAPLSGDNYSRSNDVIQVEWSPTELDTSVQVEVKTSCPGQTAASSYLQYQQEDTGSLVIDAGSLADDDLTGTCSSTINLIRTRLGEFDSAFTGGHVAGHQIRTLSIHTTD